MSADEIALSPPSVSAVITIYNAAPYLTETLDRICNQSLHEIEIICIDDASSDGSAEILREYCARDTRIKPVFNRENLGAGSSRNIGLQMAMGEYLIFLDADDLYERDMLRSAFQKATRCDADMVVFRVRGQNAQTGRPIPMDFCIRPDLIPSKEVFSANDVKKDVFECFTVWAWNKLYRREFIISTGVRFQEIRTTNDLFFVYALLLVAKRVCCLDNVLITHRLAVPNSLSNTREQSYACLIQAYEKLLSFMKENDLLRRYGNDFNNHILRNMEWHIDTIGGDAFFLLFYAMKAYVNDVIDPGITTFDDHTKTLYHRFSQMTANEYVVTRKNEFRSALEHTNYDILELKNLTAETAQHLADKTSELQGIRTELHATQIELQGARIELQDIQAELRGAQTELQATQTELQGARTELQAIQTELQATQTELHATQTSLQAALDDALAQISAVRTSTSWRVTRPLRGLGYLMRGRAGAVLLGLGVPLARVERLARVAGTDGPAPKRASRVLFYVAVRATIRIFPNATRQAGRLAPARWPWLNRHYQTYLAKALAHPVEEDPLALAAEQPKAFDSKSYWSERYRSGGTSGAGSYGRLAEFKAEIINAFVEAHGIDSVIEFGCGDGAQLSLAHYPTYLGFDVADESIDLCRSKFAQDTTKAFQNVLQYRHERADLTLSLDVIYHLVEEHVFHAHMRHLFFSANRYVIVYSSNFDRYWPAPHVKHRKFTDWVKAYHTNFGLVRDIANRYPLVADDQTESFADFYIFEKLPSKKHCLPGHLIVSVTSYRKRFPTLELAMRRILHQSTLPDETVLWISPQDSEHLPDGVVELQHSGLSIQETKDLGPYKKIIPALKRYPDSFIITLDDDQMYPRDVIEPLVTNYRSAAEVLCRRAHEMRFDSEGQLLPYLQWRHEVQDRDDRPNLFPTGVGGVLYPPKVLAPQVLDETQFRRLAPSTDDVWLFWMGRLAGSTVRVVGPHWPTAMLPGADEEQLHYGNNDGGGNDRAIAAMMAHYGSPFHYARKSWVCA